MYSLYVLYTFGIPLSTINRLISQDITLDDFIKQNEKIQQLRIKKPALVSKILNFIPYLSKEQIENNIAQLAHEGLSKTIINLLIELKITYDHLNTLTLEQLNEMAGSNKQSVFYKIKDAYEKVEGNKGRVPQSTIKEKVMEILKSLEFEQTVSIEELGCQISLDKDKSSLESIIHSLCKEKYIEYYAPFIKRYYPGLEDYLNLDFPDKQIFMERLNGSSSNQLAEKYSFSRQGILNIQKRVIRRLPELKEDKRYAEIFQKFNFDEELFCKIFNETKVVYTYLGLKYNKGEKPLLEDLYNRRFTDAQRKIILRHFHCITDMNGEVREISKSVIFEQVVSKYANDPVEDKDMVEKFNDYVIKNNLPSSYLSDESSLRGISERCEMIIRGKSHTYRYYNYDIVSQDIIQSLLDLLRLETGVYSMKKIFNENQELMEEIDIRTEHELHNLYKRKIQMENVTFNRMPEFTVGNIDKRAFLLGLFKEFAPISLTEFLEFLEETYGIRADSTRSYILSNLHEYLEGDLIKTDYVLIPNQDLSRLKALLSEPIYTLEEMKKIGSSINAAFEDYFVNNMTLSKIGYSIKSSYVLKNCYSNVEQYFREMILSKDYFFNEHLPIYQSQSFRALVYNLEKNHDIFKVEKDSYITMKKLSEAEITKEDIKSFKNSILSFIEKNQYFSLHSLRAAGFWHPLEDLGFTDVFYERLIWTFNQFSTIPLTEGYIFKMTDSKISLTDFLYDFVLYKRVVKIENLIDEVNSNYGILLDVSNVLYLLRKTDIYYSNDLYKLYVDKEDYYEEVYE